MSCATFSTSSGNALAKKQVQLITIELGLKYKGCAFAIKELAVCYLFSTLFQIKLLPYFHDF